MKNKTSENETARTLARESITQLSADWKKASIRIELPTLIVSMTHDIIFLDYDKTDLEQVCKNGDIPALQNLIGQGFDIHLGDEFALHIASTYGRTKLVEFILSHNADINADNGLALRMAVKYMHLETVELLLKHGADLHVNDDEALRTAVGNAHVGIARLLLENGADVHANDEEAMRKASDSNYLKTIFLLLDYGAPIDLLAPYQRQEVERFRKKDQERLGKIKKNIHAAETLTQIFQASVWAGHVNEMRELWNQVPDALQTEFDFSHALTQARHQTLRLSSAKLVIK